jgi:hypothetical protein
MQKEIYKNMTQFSSFFKFATVQYWGTALLIALVLTWGLSFLPDGRDRQNLQYVEYDQIQVLEEEIESKDLIIEKYAAALAEANEIIEEANGEINNAKSYQWESYDEMGNALESLKEKDTVYFSE